MTLEMDEIDYNFVHHVLIGAKLTFENIGADPLTCAAKRKRNREMAKMANEAYDILTDAMLKGKAKESEAAK